MRNRSRFFGSLWLSRTAALVILIVSSAHAQVLTGTLFGTVKDASGGVLPLATIRVLSRALFGGMASTAANDRGQFRIPELPPGEYRLEIESPGFEKYGEDQIRIAVGGSIERNVVLDVATVSESVIVTTPLSSIDVRRSSLSNRFGSEDLKTIPVRRYSMFDFLKAAPGVSPASPSSGTNNSVSVFGGGVNENAFLLDGNNFT